MNLSYSKGIRRLPRNLTRPICSNVTLCVKWFVFGTHGMNEQRDPFTSFRMIKDLRNIYELENWNNKSYSCLREVQIFLDDYSHLSIFCFCLGRLWFKWKIYRLRIESRGFCTQCSDWIFPLVQKRRPR